MTAGWSAPWSAWRRASSFRDARESLKISEDWPRTVDCVYVQSPRLFKKWRQPSTASTPTFERLPAHQPLPNLKAMPDYDTGVSRCMDAMRSPLAQG